MLRDDDEQDEPEYHCHICRRSFSSFSSLDDHMAEHQGPQQCGNCGKRLEPDEYCRCHY